MPRQDTEEDLDRAVYVLLCRVLPRGKWYRHCPGLISWTKIQEFRGSADSFGLKTLILSRNEWTHIGLPRTPDATEYFNLENQKQAGKGGLRNRKRNKRNP